MNTIYNTLRTDKAYKLYEGYLYEVAGEEYEEVLDAVLPKNIVFMDTDTCGYTFLLNEDGTVYDEVSFYKFDDKYWLASHKELETYLEGSEYNFTLTEISSQYKMLQLEGKQAGEIAQQFYEYDISTLNFRGIVEMSYEGQEGYLARFGFTGEFGYQFFLPEHAMQQFEKEMLDGISEYSNELDTYLRFEVGQPIEAIYQQEDYSLYELGYSWNLDFTKDEFKGREALLSSIELTNLKSVGFKTSDKVVPGASVIFDDEIVGKVCWTADQKGSLDSYLGLMIVDKNFAHAGVSFVTDNEVVLQTLSSPYQIPESWNK
jgi:aminomethyltransferase